MTSTGNVGSYSDIAGWFTPIDKFLFDTVLTDQAERADQAGTTGTLVELGAYLGRSAVVIAEYVRPDERFVVVDLFGGTADARQSADSANVRENDRAYASLSRERFEQNYRSLHDELPEIVQGLSSGVLEHVEPHTARFVHVDASHLYDNVVTDLANACGLLLTEGVVVIDDYRSAHTPGVAAATWEAVRENGLRPFAISPQKLYATWGDPSPYHRAVQTAVDAHPRLATELIRLREHHIVRVSQPKVAADEEELQKRSEKGAKAAAATRTEALRQVDDFLDPPQRTGRLRDLTPPVLARWLEARRTR